MVGFVCLCHSVILLLVLICVGYFEKDRSGFESVHCVCVCVLLLVMTGLKQRCW